MILSCPACKTRYVVPDSAIGVAGRQVRCAACKHSWFQQGHPVREPAMASAGAEQAVVPPPAPSQAAFAIDRDPPMMPADPPPFRAAPEPVYHEEAAADPYDEDPDFRPRRNPAKLWTMVAIGLAAIMLAALAALYFLPEGMLRTAAATPSTPLVLEVTKKPERRPLESGNELLAVSGRIVNPTGQAQKVPQIRAELRDAQGRVVYDWEISAPVTELAANGTANFNSAEVDVPRGARRLSLSFAQAF